MEKIRIVIVEDEFFIAEDIEKKLSQHGYDVIGVFDKATEAYACIVKDKPDVVLVDIHLSGNIDGIDMVKKVQEDYLFPLVYITANSNRTAYERAKATRPNAFLVKPFNHSILLAALDLALLNFSDNIMAERADSVSLQRPVTNELIINQHIFIKSADRYVKIHLDNILFVKAAGSYVHIQTTDHCYTLSDNLLQFQRKTLLPSFQKVHRSYIVNLNKVDSFENSQIFIQQHAIPLSETHRSEFVRRIHCL